MVSFPEPLQVKGRWSTESHCSCRVHHETRPRCQGYSVSQGSERLRSLCSQSAPRYFGKIQDKDDDYYMQFNLVICGLDSVEARRWMSATLVNLVDPENPESLKPLIDGGTEGQSALDPYISYFSIPRYVRFQRASTRHPPHHHIMLRVFP